MSETANATLTDGQWIVGVSFNPSNNLKVDELKRKAADFIDAVQAISASNGENEVPQELAGQVARLKALAITHVETAAMFAVKAATKQAR